MVRDGRGGYWFGFAAILTGSSWTSEPIIETTGGFGAVFRIPGTESFLLPASVENPNSHHPAANALPFRPLVEQGDT